MSARAPSPPVLVAGREPGRILRFCIVGLGNSLLTLATFTALTALRCPPAAASAIGFGVGAVNSFLCNRRWTFAGLAATHRAAWRFSAIQGAGALASAAGVGALTAGGWPRMAAECAVLPCVTASVYGLSRLFVFRAAAE